MKNIFLTCFSTDYKQSTIKLRREHDTLHMESVRERKTVILKEMEGTAFDSFKMLQRSNDEHCFEEFLFALENIYDFSSSYTIGDIDMLSRFRTAEILLSCGFIEDDSIDTSLISKSLKIISNFCESNECSNYFVSIGLVDCAQRYLFCSMLNTKRVLNTLRILVKIVSSGYHKLVLQKITADKILQILTIYYQNTKMYSIIGELVYSLSSVDLQEELSTFLKIIDFSIAKVNFYSNYWVLCSVILLIKSPSIARGFISSNIFVRFLNEAFEQEEIEIWDPAIRLIHALYFYIDDYIADFDYSCFLKLVANEDETIVELAFKTIANIMTSDNMTELMIKIGIVPLLTVNDNKPYSTSCAILNALTNAVLTCNKKDIVVFINHHVMKSLIYGLMFEKRKLCLKVLKSINKILEFDPENEVVKEDFCDCFDYQIFTNILQSSSKENSDFANFLLKTYPNYFGL